MARTIDSVEVEDVGELNETAEASLVRIEEFAGSKEYSEKCVALKLGSFSARALTDEQARTLGEALVEFAEADLGEVDDGNVENYFEEAEE